MALLCHWRRGIKNITIFYRDQPGEDCGGSVALITLAMEGWVLAVSKKRSPVAKRLQQLWNDERGQDIAEYAVMLAVILVIVVGTIRLIGSNANNVFSSVGSSIQ